MPRGAALWLRRRAERRRRDGVAAAQWRAALLSWLLWPWRAYDACRWLLWPLLWPHGPRYGASRRAGGSSALGCRGAHFNHIGREARTGLTREGREEGGVSRPGAPNIPCGSRRGRSGIQRVRGASCLRLLTINIPNGNSRCGRGPRPAPGRPASLHVPAHTHDNLYPSTSSTPPASHTGRRRVPIARSTRLTAVD